LAFAFGAFGSDLKSLTLWRRGRLDGLWMGWMLLDQIPDGRQDEG